MSKKSSLMYLFWEITLSKESFLLFARDMLDVLWCVTHRFVIFVVFGCDHEISSRHQGFLICSKSFGNCCCGKWGGVCNCDVVIVCNILGVGVFFLNLLRGGGDNPPGGMRGVIMFTRASFLRQLLKKIGFRIYTNHWEEIRICSRGLFDMH